MDIQWIETPQSRAVLKRVDILVPILCCLTAVAGAAYILFRDRRTTMRLLKLIVLAAIAMPAASFSPAVAMNDSQDGDRQICKYRLQTGTRFKTKVCKTASEWEAMAEAHRNGLKEIVDRPQILVCGPKGCD